MSECQSHLCTSFKMFGKIGFQIKKSISVMEKLSFVAGYVCRLMGDKWQSSFESKLIHIQDVRQPLLTSSNWNLCDKWECSLCFQHIIIPHPGFSFKSGDKEGGYNTWDYYRGCCLTPWLGASRARVLCARIKIKMSKWKVWLTLISSICCVLLFCCRWNICETAAVSTYHDDTFWCHGIPAS